MSGINICRSLGSIVSIRGTYATQVKQKHGCLLARFYRLFQPLAVLMADFLTVLHSTPLSGRPTVD